MSRTAFDIGAECARPTSSLQPEAACHGAVSMGGWRESSNSSGQANGLCVRLAEADATHGYCADAMDAGFEEGVESPHREMAMPLDGEQHGIEAVRRLRQALEDYQRERARRAGWERRFVATGLTALDEKLPHGGLPCGAITEILADAPGAGAMSLAMRIARQAILPIANCRLPIDALRPFVPSSTGHRGSARGFLSSRGDGMGNRP